MNRPTRGVGGAARRLPQWLWAPGAAAVVIAVPAVVALAVGQPWLVPSLGPTVFLQVLTPDNRAARPYPALMGHAIGAVAALVAVFLLGAAGDPSPLAGGPLTEGRAGATVLGVALTIALQLLLRANHPPAAATAMLITLGGVKPTVLDLAALAGGVVAVVVVGEGARRLRTELA